MNNILEGTLYKYKENIYRVLSLVKIKNEINSSWYIGVRYQKTRESKSADWSGYKIISNSPEYVRSYKDFIKKFEVVE